MDYHQQNVAHQQKIIYVTKDKKKWKEEGGGGVVRSYVTVLTTYLSPFWRHKRSIRKKRTKHIFSSLLVQIDKVDCLTLIR